MHRPNNSLRLTTKSRAGVSLVIVLVVLTLLTGFAVTWAQRVMLRHRQTSERAFAVQANWLAESALQRAIAQFASNQHYGGETWELAAEELQGTRNARIEIKITPGQQADQRSIEVLVDYPVDSLLRQRVRRQQQMLLSNAENETTP